MLSNMATIAWSVWIGAGIQGPLTHKAHLRQKRIIQEKLDRAVVSLRLPSHSYSLRLPHLNTALTNLSHWASNKKSAHNERFFMREGVYDFDVSAPVPEKPHGY